MEESNRQTKFDEGYLTSAISQMEFLVEKLDGKSPRDSAILRTRESSIDTRNDCASGDESIRPPHISPPSPQSSTSRSVSAFGSVCDRMSTLTANLNVSKEEMRALLRSNATLRHKNVTLTRQVQDSEEKYQSLRNRLRVVRQELHRKSSAPVSSVNNIQVPVAAPKTDEVAIRALRHQIDSLTSTLRKTETKMDEERIKLDAAREKIQMLEAKAKDLEEEKLNLNESVRYLNSEIDYLQQELEKKTSNERVLAAETSRQISSLSEELKTVSSKLIDSQNQLTEEVRTKEELGLKLRSVTVELSKTRNKSAQHERDLKHAIQHAHAVKSSSLTNTEELAGLRNSLRVYLNRIRKQEDRIRDLEEKLFEYQKRELVKAPVYVRKFRRETPESERTVSPVETLHDCS